MFMKKQHLIIFLVVTSIAIMGMGFFALQKLPLLQMKASQALIWMRGAIHPSGVLPTAEADNAKLVVEKPFWLPDLISVPSDLSTSLNPVHAKQTSVDLLASVVLAQPVFNAQKDYQDWNNCGPATLALALRYWGWQGDQFTISEVVRPKRQDKNVNIEELAGYVNGSAEGLQAEVRVGGDQALLESLIADGYPVVIEESFKVEKSAWPGDDLWAGHYLLLTGYDKQSQFFTVQDSYYGADRQITYTDLLKDWQAFNHVYLVIFPSGDLRKVQKLLGEDWLVEANLKRTVTALHNQLQSEPGNAFAWFNLGSSLTGLQEYASAVQAFDEARAFGLPSRMLRYQFGPLIAAYQTGDQKDLMRLADYALQITPDSEEALLWKGWAYELEGDHLSAIDLFHKALEANPGNQDAQKALERVRP
jgi:tetratricopeptide (TPR) repeat protein